MNDEIKDNILSQSQWLRILWMALYAVVCWVLGIVMTVLVVGQALFSLITGSDNDNLRQLGANLSIYFYQILGFLTYNTDEKPFPFSAFPGNEGDDDDEDSEESAEESGYSYQASNNDDVFADMSFTKSKDASPSADDVATGAYDIADDEIPTLGSDDITDDRADDSNETPDYETDGTQKPENKSE